MSEVSSSTSSPATLPEMRPASDNPRLKLIEERDLLNACERGNLQNVMRLIMQKNVNPDARDGMQNTPLICSSHHGHYDIVSFLLLQTSADKNAVNKNSCSSLIAASFYGHFEIVKLLLEAGGLDVDLIDRHGDSALMKAVDSGHDQICTMLLFFGANQLKLKVWLDTNSRARKGSILNQFNLEINRFENIKKLLNEVPVVWTSYICIYGLKLTLQSEDIENLLQFY